MVFKAASPAGQTFVAHLNTQYVGYIPTRAAYEEGGYEVELAHLFYLNFRPKAGGLELLVERAVDRVRDVSHP